jgi:hypothetical protein
MPDNMQYSKVKIGTILDAATIETLKERAFREKKTISAVLEEAVAQLGKSDAPDIEARARALQRLFATPFRLTKREWSTVFEDDAYDQ